MDKNNNIKSQIELFHLLFLEQLSLKLDKRLYALKGGCNLRFFLNSVRYSEDIDFDVHTVAVPTLENMVSKILTGIPFKQLLSSRSISLTDFSTPKQTETTQRWKIKLKVPFHTLDINTKIEFSRRQSTLGAILETVSKNLSTHYNLRPVFISHYPAASALQQKILALIMRTETQARDIFDIYMLLHNGASITNKKFTAEQLDTAADNANSIKLADFTAQVVSYLETEYIEQYTSAHVWHSMLTEVIDYIGALHETD